MARLIDADALMGDIQEELEYECRVYTAEQNKWIDAGLRIAANNIRRSPTVDAVPVVRCCQCSKRYDADECPMCHLVEGEYNEYTADDGFCDRGERKTDA